MKIKNGWKEFGDNFDGAKIQLSHEEFKVFHKVFMTCISNKKLSENEFSEEEIRIAFEFCNLY